MLNKILINIPKYEDLKKYRISDLESLAFTIRKKLIELSKNKAIHLSSNLGIVELSIASLVVFNSPKDKIIYDTGHQSYAHKILTDRFDDIETIRDTNGLSGFQNPKESIHDFVSLGHSGTALSIAQGATEHSNSNHYFVPIIGDAAFTTGINFEALNNIAYNRTKMIIIINDNNMSISKNVGYFSTLFKESEFYVDSANLKKIFNKKEEVKNDFKKIVELMNFKYIGLVDGNNLLETINALKDAKYHSKFKPVIVHVKTQKGKGLIEAEKDKVGKYHSTKITDENNIENFGYHASNFLEQIIQMDENVMILNPGMTYSSGFLNLEMNYPNNIEDLGIAEEHTVSKAAGISLVNKKVFINIYSTFLQRSYDSIMQDIARNRLNPVFLVDRADISYNDGNTHHGIYDIGFLKTMNNCIITSPSNKYELERLIYLGYKNEIDPFFIRYPKDKCSLDVSHTKKFNFGEWIQIFKRLGAKKCIISYGNPIDILKNKMNCNHDFDLINAIFITHYYKDEVIKILKKYKTIFVYEKVVDSGCLGNDLIQIAFENKIDVTIVKQNIKNNFIDHGNKIDIDKMLELDIDDFIKKVIKYN